MVLNFSEREKRRIEEKQKQKQKDLNYYSENRRKKWNSNKIDLFTVIFEYIRWNWIGQN